MEIISYMWIRIQNILNTHTRLNTYTSYPHLPTHRTHPSDPVCLIVSGSGVLGLVAEVGVSAGQLRSKYFHRPVYVLYDVWS